MTAVPKVRQRAIQQRAEETQEAILLAAVELFTTQGFDGISIKAIEQASGTKRGLVTYHFDDKESLWRQVADHVFNQLSQLSKAETAAIQSLEVEAQVRAHLTHFIIQSARHPEVSRLIIQEGKAMTWRLEYLVDTHIRPRLSMLAGLMDRKLDAHTLYMFLGAATLVFDVEAEVERMFGFNPRQDEFVIEHAKRVCDLFIPTLLAPG